MTKEEALDLALEALEKSVATCFDRCAHEQVMSRPEHFINQAITAIKQARSAPVQEPVAIHQVLLDGGWADCDATEMLRYAAYETRVVYTTPPAAQRQWVGLTERDVGEVIDYVHTNSRYGHHHTGFWMDFYRAIEAKLKEKNT